MLGGSTLSVFLSVSRRRRREDEPRSCHISPGCGCMHAGKCGGQGDERQGGRVRNGRAQQRTAQRRGGRRGLHRLSRSLPFRRLCAPACTRSMRQSQHVQTPTDARWAKECVVRPRAGRGRKAAVRRMLRRAGRGFETGAPRLERTPGRMESRPRAPWWEGHRLRRMPPHHGAASPSHGYCRTPGASRGSSSCSTWRLPDWLSP